MPRGVLLKEGSLHVGLYSDLNRPALEEDAFFEGRQVHKHTWAEILQQRASGDMLPKYTEPREMVL